MKKTFFTSIITILLFFPFLSYASTTDTHGQTANDNGYCTPSVCRGIKFHTNADLYLVSVDKFGSGTCTHAYLYTNPAGSVLASASFSGNTATFSNYTLANNTDYYIMVKNNAGGDCYAYQKDTASFPYNGTNVNFTASYYNGSDTTARVQAIYSITTDLIPAPPTADSTINFIGLPLLDFNGTSTVNSSTGVTVWQGTYKANTTTQDLINTLTNKTQQNIFYGIILFFLSLFWIVGYFSYKLTKK